MKYVEKKTLEPDHLFMVYYAANNDRLQNDISESIGRVMTPSEIWLWFTNYRNHREKEALHQSLLEEQGHICAFCGCRIARETNFSVEHFLPKSRIENGVFVNKHLTLDYKNLFASCETKEKVDTIIDFPIKDHPELDKLNDIADFLDISVEHLILENKQFKKMIGNDAVSSVNTSITNSNHHIRSIKYKQNIKHCNLAKLSKTTTVLNPTSAEAINCESRFVYFITEKQGKKYCKIEIEQTDDQLIVDTVNVFNLNATNLSEQRVDIYNETDLFLNGLNQLLQMGIINENQQVQEIQREITNIYQKVDGKLKPFCFVQVSLLSRFISK